MSLSTPGKLWSVLNFYFHVTFNIDFKHASYFPQRKNTAKITFPEGVQVQGVIVCYIFCYRRGFGFQKVCPLEIKKKENEKVLRWKRTPSRIKSHSLEVCKNRKFQTGKCFMLKGTVLNKNDFLECHLTNNALLLLLLINRSQILILVFSHYFYCMRCYIMKNNLTYLSYEVRY
jgi:hypothetical protein